MSKQVERHDISDELYVYLQDNSKRWYARIKVAGKWYSKATKQKEKEKAIGMAYRLQMEYQFMADRNILVSTKRYRDVAEKAISTMQEALDNETGALNYKTYIQVLRKYHIPFFDRIYITSIDSEKLREFDKWRIEQFKRVPAKSTLLNHNAAMQLVFKEAVDHKWMLAAQVPPLSTKGAGSQRRAHFSHEEYERAFDAVLALEQNSIREKTRQIRELLLDYMEFAVNTGIRPGTEMESLTWGDINIDSNEHNIIFYITVRKGKTVKHTGIREVVCRDEIFSSVQALRERFPNRKPSDKLFRLADGSSSNELGKAFEKAVSEIGLKSSPHGVRTLYSLRHTYITWQLMSGDVNMEVLAKQCGTSIAMIEQHYSHVTPKMYSKELSGVDLGKEKPKVKDKKTSGSKQNEARLSALFKEWQANYKLRGCI
ncbi:site-specific recombinase phage integrase family protein [Shewanella algicola]|uniref:Site-specific integrase n=1 Tax=Shewanella algicola TaxID=640633 RepID=A0A9X1ZBI6_9GAMM|nr:site-specific integrase [Shewanella algicola]MCL1107297.1 site-specific integrase [Shewanella algicola]GGP67184.1 site-specific recombinase phage integrase family protein [Shewanella algicola]